jgi:hypothetical protein
MLYGAGRSQSDPFPLPTTTPLLGLLLPLLLQLLLQLLWAESQADGLTFWLLSVVCNDLALQAT